MLTRSFRRIMIGVLLAVLASFQFTQVATASPVQKTVYISTQKFEHGSMIWRNDNSDIWVLVEVGQQRAYKFTAAMYGNLPQNTAVPPAGRIKPIFGFGAVWANYSYVRDALGWATLPEISYNGVIDNTTPGRIRFPRLDDQVTTIFGQPGSYAWRLEPAATSTTTYAAFQAFEDGYMVWRADTQQVQIFYGKQGSTNFDGYSVDNYGKFPDNPVTDAPPAGRVKPVNAFGRVWGYLWTHNDRRLGWATGPEQGYTATAARLPMDADSWTVRNSITFPDGRKAVISIGELVVYWQLQS